MSPSWHMGPHSECATVQHVTKSSLVAAQVAPAMCDGLVEGDFKTTEVVQRPNSVSKTVYCL